MIRYKRLRSTLERLLMEDYTLLSPTYWNSQTGIPHEVVPKESIQDFYRGLGVGRGRWLFVATYSGDYYEMLRKVNPHGVGLDFSEAQLKRIKGLRVLADMRWMPFRDNSFTHVISFEPTPLLIHTVGLKPTILALKEMIRVAEPGGKLVLLVGKEYHQDLEAIRRFLEHHGVRTEIRDISEHAAKGGPLYAFIYHVPERKKWVLNELSYILQLITHKNVEELLQREDVVKLLRALYK